MAPMTGDWFIAKSLSTQKSTKSERADIYIDIMNGIRTHNPVITVQDNTFPKPVFLQGGCHEIFFLVEAKICPMTKILN